MLIPTAVCHRLCRSCRNRLCHSCHARFVLLLCLTLRLSLSFFDVTCLTASFFSGSLARLLRLSFSLRTPCAYVLFVACLLRVFSHYTHLHVFVAFSRMPSLLMASVCFIGLMYCLLACLPLACLPACLRSLLVPCFALLCLALACLALPRRPGLPFACCACWLSLFVLVGGFCCFQALLRRPRCRNCKLGALRERDICARWPSAGSQLESLICCAW